MIIFRSNTGQFVTLDAGPSDTVRNLKVKIQDKEGIGLDDFALTHAGKLLGYFAGAQPGKEGSNPEDDDRTLESYGVQEEDTVHGLYKGV